MWTADRDAAGRLFASEVARHSDRLGAYEEDLRKVESRPEGGQPPVMHPDFGNYAALRCGIGYERQRIGWLQWMSEQLAAHRAEP